VKVPANYPRQCELRAYTRDGTEYFIRPIVPEDLQRELAFARALSEESRYHRLMYVLHEPTEAQLAPLIHVDYERNMALVALYGPEREQQIIGVARYARDDDGAAHEFAVAVADQWQRRGVGSRLLEELFEYARTRGLRRLYGRVLNDNAHMLSLARTLGLTITQSADDPHTATVELDVSAVHP
jgi:acetyltransferase